MILMGVLALPIVLHREPLCIQINAVRQISDFVVAYVVFGEFFLKRPESPCFHCFVCDAKPMLWKHKLRNL